MERVSVIIPVYNSEKTIQQCIETVLDNNYQDFELIVADDCSTDRSRKIIAHILKKRSFTFLQNKENRGPGFTRNKGIRRAKGKLIILLDSDSYVPKNWIEQHVKAHEEISAHIIGGGIEGIHNTISGRCDGYFNSVLNVPRSKSFFLKRFHLPTNNMSVKKKVFEKTGYFIEDAKSGEDVVFCHLALKNKLKIYFKSDIIIHHYDRNGFKEFLRHQAMWGDQAIRTRKKMKMDHSYLLPNSYLMAHFYIVPLAIIFTAHVIYKWILYEPAVLLYSPLLFLSKLVHANAIKDSLKPKKSLFLDRDGVINKNVKNLTKPEQFEIIKGAPKAIKLINDSGYMAILITNQPIIAKGFCTFEELDKIHDKMKKELLVCDAHIDAIYICPHHPEKGFEGEVKELKIDCKCRKPKPWLMLKAAKEHNIDLSKSWMIGDSYSDIAAGQKAGVKTALLTTGYIHSEREEEFKEIKPDLVCKNLLEAVETILNSC